MIYHINAQYLFVTNIIKSGEMIIEYWPNLYMIGYYFTKPLQGSVFQKFRNLIIGIEETDVTMYHTKVHEWIKVRNIISLLKP